VRHFPDAISQFAILSYLRESVPGAMEEYKTMRTIILALALSFAATAANAQATCSAEAANKKLAGAAKNSFIQKCEKDASATCEKQAADKKLAGAAKTSFTTKCVKDAVGS